MDRCSSLLVSETCVGFKDKLIFDSSLLDGNMLHEVQEKIPVLALSPQQQDKDFFLTLSDLFRFLGISNRPMSTASSQGITELMTS